MHHQQIATPASSMTFDEALATIPYSRTFEINGTERTYTYTEEDRIGAAREAMFRAQDEAERNAMTPEQRELIDLRKSLGITQVQMAAAIGMPTRTYQTLENGASVVKPWHLKAAKYAAMEYVISQPETATIDLVPSDIVTVARSAAGYFDDMKKRRKSAD